MNNEQVANNTPKKESSWVTRIGAKTQPPETPRIEDAQYMQDSKDEAKLKDYINKAHEQVVQTDYFQRRGLSQATIERFKLGYDPSFRTKEGVEFVAWQAVIIPTSPYSYTVRNTELSAEIHNRIRKKGPSIIYNPIALQSGKPVFIVEGEIDALSLIEAGAEALALSSTANINQLIKIIGKEAPAAGLVLSLDNDPEGRQTTVELSLALKSLGIHYIEANVAGEYKDPNEALTMARGQFIQAVQATQDSLFEELQAAQRAERESYLKNSTAYHIQDFINGINERVNTPFIPTGFDKLDLLLEGGIFEGLYIIEALPSSGKTSFVMQVVDEVARAGNDVLIFSLETARAELMAKSISRLTFTDGNKTGHPKTAREITTNVKYQQYSSEEQELIKTSIDHYGEFAGRIYISEGSGDIGTEQVKETLSKHILFTGNKPVIVIDCLQLLAPYDPRGTDKQNMDKALMELKRISRDYKLPVLAVSCSNRQYYNSLVTMEAMESCIIDYSSDVLIGLRAKGAGEKDFNIDLADHQYPRQIELTILKNRNGNADRSVFYDYYPMFNYFEEV